MPFVEQNVFPQLWHYRCTAIRDRTPMNEDGFLDFVFVGGGFLSDGIEVVFQEPQVSGFFLRGDCNGDLLFNISDAIAALGYLFLGDAEPGCIESCNADADTPGKLDISDPVLMLNSLFLGGSAGRLPRCEVNAFEDLCGESRCSE